MKRFMQFIAAPILALGILSCGNMLSEDDGIHIVVDELDGTNTAKTARTLHLHLSNYASAQWYIGGGSPELTDGVQEEVTYYTEKPGSFEITAVTTEKKEYRYTLRVVDRIIVEYGFYNKVDLVKIGETLSLRMGSGYSAQWSVDYDDVAEISTLTGLVESDLASLKVIKAGNGKVTVTAQSNGKSYTCTIFIANVEFTNESEYKVTVRRDSFSGTVIAEVPPSGTALGYVQSGSEEATLYYSYSKLVYKGDEDYEPVWLGIENKNDYQRTFDSRDLNSKLRPISITAPENVEFTAVYLKIDNKSNTSFSLYAGNSMQVKTVRNTLNVQPETWGIYKVTPSGDMLFTDFALKTSDSLIPIVGLPAQNGIYECTFSGGTQSLTPVLKN